MPDNEVSRIASLVCFWFWCRNYCWNSEEETSYYGPASLYCAPPPKSAEDKRKAPADSVSEPKSKKPKKSAKKKEHPLKDDYLAQLEKEERAQLRKMVKGGASKKTLKKKRT